MTVSSGPLYENSDISTGAVTINYIVTAPVHCFINCQLNISTQTPFKVSIKCKKLRLRPI